MSSDALTWAKGQAAGSSSLKGLLLLLGDVANEHGVLWAGVDYLAGIMECNRTTMMQNLRKLQDAGVIHRIERRKPNGARHGTITVLGPSGGPTRSPMKAAETHPMYGDVIAESLSRESPPRESPRGISGAPRSENPTRTNIEPESATDVADSPGARTRRQETDPEAVRLCGVLRDLILANDPAAKIPTSDSAARDSWVRDMRLLITDRKGDVALVEQVLRWCQADDFWRANVLSPAKLRKQFTQLLLRMPVDGSARGAAQDARMQARLARIAALEDQPHEGDNDDHHQLDPGLVLAAGQR